MHNHEHSLVNLGDILIFILIGLGIALYSWTVFYSTRKKGLRSWPLLKTIFWTLGISCATVSLIGPLANVATTDFKTHMVTHLLLGMLAPLFFVLSSPITLLMRTLPVKLGRNVSRILKSRFLRFISHPVTAAFLNIAGLWLLYTTELYHYMHQSLTLHILIHFHVFAAGYLFTSSIIYFEPISHRFSFKYRTIVFIFFVTAHSILSKYIYANPPVGVGRHEAEAGAKIMYYGGDIIDALLIYILFRQWFISTKPNVLLAVRR